MNKTIKPEDRAVPERLRFSTPVSRSPKTITGVAGLLVSIYVLSRLGLSLRNEDVLIKALYVVAGYGLAIGIDRSWDIPGISILSYAGRVYPSLVPMTVVTMAHLWQTGTLGEVGVGPFARALTFTLGPIDESPDAVRHLYELSTLLLPLIVATICIIIMMRLAPPETRANAIFGVAFGLLISRFGMLLIVVDTDETVLSSMFALDGAFFGAALALWDPPNRLGPRQTQVVTGIALTTLFGLAMFKPSGATGIALVEGVVTLFTLILIYAALIDSSSVVNDRLYNTSYAKWLGKRTAGLLIWSGLFIYLFNPTRTGSDPVEFFGWPGFEVFAARLIFTLAAAAITYRYLEVPIQLAVRSVARRERFYRRFQRGDRPSLTLPPVTTRSRTRRGL